MGRTEDALPSFDVVESLPELFDRSRGGTHLRQHRMDVFGLEGDREDEPPKKEEEDDGSGDGSSWTLLCCCRNSLHERRRDGVGVIGCIGDRGSGRLRESKGRRGGRGSATDEGVSSRKGEAHLSTQSRDWSRKLSIWHSREVFRDVPVDHAEVDRRYESCWMWLMKNRPRPASERESFKKDEGQFSGGVIKLWVGRVG